MGQITVRAGDELLQRVKSAASSRGRSMNDYVTSVLDAATNPDLGGDDASRVRERLARAGLLSASTVRVTRPPTDEVVAARAGAGGGTLLSDLVRHGRG